MILNIIKYAERFGVVKAQVDSDTALFEARPCPFLAGVTERT